MRKTHCYKKEHAVVGLLVRKQTKAKKVNHSSNCLLTARLDGFADDGEDQPTPGDAPV